MANKDARHNLRETGRVHEAQSSVPLITTEDGRVTAAVDVPQHHTSRTNFTHCPSCRADVKSGNHPMENYTSGGSMTPRISSAEGYRPAE